MRIQRKRDLTAGEIATIDPSKKKDYQRRFKAHNLDVVLHESGVARLNYWRVHDKANGTVRTCGFDVDLDRYLAQLDTGRPFDRIDLFKGTSVRAPESGPGAGVQSKAAADAPLCVVCGHPGGLPCPSMVKGGLSSGFVMAVPVGSPAFATQHVHPGRCRKRLRAHLDAGTARANSAAS